MDKKFTQNLINLENAISDITSGRISDQLDVIRKKMGTPSSHVNGLWSGADTIICHPDHDRDIANLSAWYGDLVLTTEFAAEASYVMFRFADCARPYVRGMMRYQYYPALIEEAIRFQKENGDGFPVVERLAAKAIELVHTIEDRHLNQEHVSRLQRPQEKPQ